MPITFDNDNDVIVYALEKVISYARTPQYIFLAQSVWWFSSIIELQEGLVIFIDNIKARSNIGKDVVQPDPINLRGSSEIDSHIQPSRVVQVRASDGNFSSSEEGSVSTTETDIHNEVIEN
jgi:hypothetical protein